MFLGGFGGILLRYHGIKWKLRFCVCWPAQRDYDWQLRTRRAASDTSNTVRETRVLWVKRWRCHGRKFAGGAPHNNRTLRSEAYSSASLDCQNKNRQNGAADDISGGDGLAVVFSGRAEGTGPRE